MAQPEPWLRGILPGLDPVVEHLLRASEQIREDACSALAAVDQAQIWTVPDGTASVGFHAKHLSGSTHRLCTYLEGGQLSPEELAALPAESHGDETAAALTGLINDALDRYETIVRSLSPATFGTTREIGRQRLQTTAISLAIHIVEHGQRHTGQLITTAKLTHFRPR